eukprot:TRINITY_DN3245_c2_g1_i13.p1 TRINITY_DN3245_c2_g1~~TRINITY_DN3245_c2_g1_i13.p1  ORF type:complete len:386 (+),score=87.10 TRINITY_DN3245_c2_g1_i13:28-1158(+)
MSEIFYYRNIDLDDRGRVVLFKDEVVSVTKREVKWYELNTLLSEHCEIKFTSHRIIVLCELMRIFVNLEDVVNHEFCERRFFGLTPSSLKLHVKPLQENEDDDIPTKYFSFEFSDKAYDIPSIMSHAFDLKAWKKIDTKVVTKEMEEAKKMHGIAGIKKKKEAALQYNDDLLGNAFNNLNSLMSSVREVVAMSNRLQKKLTNDSEKNEFDEMMIDLGISSPVTKSQFKSDYHTQLAFEFADFLTKLLPQAKGAMTLTDFYCYYNRARGAELISPDDMLCALNILPSTSQFVVTEFPNGVKLIQENSKSLDNLKNQVINFLEKDVSKGVSVVNIGNHLGIALGVAEMLLYQYEIDGLIVRDDSICGKLYYFNCFVNF